MKKIIITVLFIFLSTSAGLIFSACVSTPADADTVVTYTENAERTAGPQGEHGEMEAMQAMEAAEMTVTVTAEPEPISVSAALWDLSAEPVYRSFIAANGGQSAGVITGGNMIPGFGAPGTTLPLTNNIPQGAAGSWRANARLNPPAEVGAAVQPDAVMPDGSERGVLRFTHDGPAQGNPGVYYRLRLDNIPLEGQAYYISTWFRIESGAVNNPAGNNADFRVTVLESETTGMASVDAIPARAREQLQNYGLSGEWTQAEMIVFVPRAMQGRFFEIRLFIPNSGTPLVIDMASVEMYPIQITGGVIPESIYVPYVDTRVPPPLDGISLTDKNSTVTREVIMRGHSFDLNHQAQWRIEADARIERYRTGDMRVTALDASGRPIQGAEVEVRMTNHEFHFGGAIHGTTFMQNEVRKRQFTDMFNAGVFENYMKWRWDEANLRYSEPMLQWMLDNNIAVRGHALIWGAWRNMPDGYRERYENDPEALRQLTFDRINYWIPFWGDRVIEWDVVNEAYAANDIQRILGDDMRDADVLARANIIDEWFWAARRISDEHNLNLRLFYNDFHLINAEGAAGTAHRAWFWQFMDGLIERGVPIDGIGAQLYYGDATNPNTRPDGPNLVRHLDALSRFGLDIKVTEFSYNDEDPVRQAINFIDVLTAVYSNPNTRAFIHWWPWGNSANHIHGGYFTNDNVLKPMGEAFAYLVYGKWWTEESGRTGADGSFGVRGHFGEYEITVRYGGQVRTVPVMFLMDGDRDFVIEF